MPLPSFITVTCLLLGTATMTDNQPARSLDIEVTETTAGQLTVVLKGYSSTTQRVSYELETRGLSNAVHKGSTTLAANSPALLSTMNFSRSDCWSVTLNVTEEVAGTYRIVRGNECD